VKTDRGPSAQLVQARSYAWAPETSQSDFYRSLPGQRIRTLVDQGLMARGLRQAAPGERPDFLVKVRYQAHDELAVFPSSWSGFYGWGYGGVGWDAYPYTEGVLTLDFVDPASRNVLWHARAMKEKSDPYLDLNDVNKAVGKILAQYPPWLRRG
jgi:hypothetical protein